MLSSKNLQYRFKNVLNKTVEYRLNSKYNAWPTNRKDWFYLWRIGYPILGSVRLKVLQKDIYCQQRRHNFGLVISPNCTMCGEVETVQNQLFIWKNAQRMWDI